MCSTTQAPCAALAGVNNNNKNNDNNKDRGNKNNDNNNDDNNNDNDDHSHNNNDYCYLRVLAKALKNYLAGVGVVKPHQHLALVLLGKELIQQGCLGMPYVQVA